MTTSAKTIVLALGILLLAGLAAFSLLGMGPTSSLAGEKEETNMSKPVSIPALDVAAPTAIETATFASG